MLLVVETTYTSPSGKVQNFREEITREDFLAEMEKSKREIPGLKNNNIHYLTGEIAIDLSYRVMGKIVTCKGYARRKEVANA